MCIYNVHVYITPTPVGVIYTYIFESGTGAGPAGEQGNLMLRWALTVKPGGVGMIIRNSLHDLNLTVVLLFDSCASDKDSSWMSVKIFPHYLHPNK